MASREIIMGMHDAYQEMKKFVSIPRTKKEIKEFIDSKIKEMDARRRGIQGVELCQKTTEEHSN